MTSRPSLAGKDRILAHFRGAGKPRLGTKQGIPADLGAMSYLRQVVDLSPVLDAGFAHAGAVNTGIGLYLDSIFQYCRARLHDLVPFSGVVPGESKAIRANDGAIL